MSATPMIEVAVSGLACVDGALLMVRRGRPPGLGYWSVPGGRVRFGETLAEAVVREVREETGLDVSVEGFAGWVERTGSDPRPFHYVILDFFVRPVGPARRPVAGDDAAEARWVPLEEVEHLSLVGGLGDFLRQVGVLSPG